MSTQNQNGCRPSDRDGTVPDRQAYFIFGIVGLALLMASIDATIVAVSLPTLLTDLSTNLAWVSWTMTGYQFSQSVSMPIAGKLSDEWGRKRLFMIAAALFTVTSIAAGLAPSVYWLIIFRVLQGFGGGAILPSATGIISDAFGSRRAQAIGLFGSIFPIGGILGPNIGGFIIDNFSWRWIFFVNIPIGLALLYFGLKILPRDKPLSLGTRVDIVGAGLFSGAILAVLYALTSWANRPEGIGMTTVLSFLAGMVCIAVLVWHEGRIAQPMVDLKLLKWRPFLAANIYNFVFGAVIFGFFSFIPYYATVAYGMTAGQDGLIMTPRSLAMMIMSAVSSFLLVRLRYRLPMVVGVLIISASLFLLSRGYHSESVMGITLGGQIIILAALVMLQGIGMGIANPAANNAALDLLPERVAAVAGMRGMFRSVGGVLGTAAIALALTRFENQALGLQRIFVFMGFFLLVLIPLTFLIPDRGQQS